MKKPGEYAALFRSMGKEWKWLFSYVSRYRLKIILYIAIGILGTAMGIGVSVAGKYLIDSVVERNRDTIVVSAVCAIGLALLQLVVNAVISRVAMVVGTKINSEIRADVYEKILFTRWENVRKYHSGDLLNRIEGDVGAVSNSIVSFVPGAFTKLTQFIGCLVVVLYYDPTMAIFAFLSTPFLFFTSRISTKMVRKYNEQSRKLNGEILSFYSESIQNLQTIKAFDITSRYVTQLKTNLQLYRRVRLDHDKFQLIMSTCLGVIGLIVSYACYGWGVWRLWSGHISYGTMTLFLQISGQLTTSFAAIVSLLPAAISIATAAGRIMEISNLPIEENKDRKAAEEMYPSACESGITVECKDLSYTYSDGDAAVVSSASFVASPGETIAFVGPSGEGKTTLLRLILGLAEPDCGSMTMAVSDGRKITVSESTRRFCSYVPQGNAVFSGSIADNLRIVKPEASDKEIEEMLTLADAWDFVSKLPEGINTAINERGVNFSEGQIQRISIARALLRGAPVLVMDEATSALDTATETRVLKNIMKAYPNRTCIITTHRPSMLAYCTRVYAINESGELIENK